MASIHVDQCDLEIHGRSIYADVSLRLTPSQPTVVIGPSGAGKTSLLRSIMGLAPVTRGRIMVNDTTIESLSAADRAATFAWLPQQPSVLHGMTVVDYLLGARYRFREPRSASRNRIMESLALCDVSALATRSVRNLSGGELQRVLLAGCFAQESQWLLLDEPANHLDPGLARSLMAMVADRHRSGLGLLVVTHHLDMLGPLQRMTGVPVRVIGIRSGQVELDSCGDRDLATELSALYDFPMRSIMVDDYFHYVPEHA